MALQAQQIRERFKQEVKNENGSGLRSDQVYLNIRGKILDGQFLPGDMLVIRDLAAELNVSMTPIRESLHRLIAEGAIESREHRSARIPLLSLASVEEIWKIRLRLEPYAVERAVPLLSNLDIDLLTQYSEQVAEAKKHSFGPEINRLVRQFYFYFYQSAGMPRLTKMIEDLWTSYMPTLAWLLEHEHRVDITGQYQEKRYGRLLKAAKKRDSQAAAQCFVDTLNFSLQRLRNTLQT